MKSTSERYLTTVPASDYSWQRYLAEETDVELLKRVLAATPTVNNKTKIKKLENRIRRLQAQEAK